jgi:CRISPR-associated endoribonuclease Cas6/Csy4 subtype I-F
MSQRFYLDFYIKNQRERVKFSNSILSGVHHHLRGRALDNVGVSFPEFGKSFTDETVPFTGNVIRLISSNEVALFTLRGSEYFTSHILNGDVAVSQVKPVPEHASEVFFVRHRQPEYEARQLKLLCPDNSKDITPYKVNKASLTPSGMIKIFTIQKPLHMFVKMMDAPERIDGTFNSYGLCTMDKQVSVPWF